MTQAQGISEMAAWRGYMIQGLVHRAFVQGGAAMTLCLLHKRLPRKKKIEEPTLLASGLQFKFTSREFFLDVNSLPTVKPGIYYIPKKKNSLEVNLNCKPLANNVGSSIFFFRGNRL